MKTLYEELISLSMELLGSWRRPRSRSGRQALQPDADPRAAALPPSSADALQLDTLSREFQHDLFAQLLIELPATRTSMAESFAAGNHRQLRDSVHQMLGAAAYCQAGELEQELRQLRLALKTDDRDTIEQHFHNTLQVMDSLLHNSGFRDRPG